MGKRLCSTGQLDANERARKYELLIILEVKGLTYDHSLITSLPSVIDYGYKGII